MKPWQLDVVKEQTKYKEAWKDYKRSDFYFGVNTHRGKTIVYICPKEYFEDNNFLFETSIPIVHLIPVHFIETLPATYETPFSEDEVIRSMVHLGFDYNAKFAKFVKNIPLLNTFREVL